MPAKHQAGLPLDELCECGHLPENHARVRWNLGTPFEFSELAGCDVCDCRRFQASGQPAAGFRYE